MRFSRLFAPGKVGNLPQVWKNIRKKKKKKRDSISEMNISANIDNDNGSGYDVKPPKEECHVDENVRILFHLFLTLTTLTINIRDLKTIQALRVETANLVYFSSYIIHRLYKVADIFRFHSNFGH